MKDRVDLKKPRKGKEWDKEAFPKESRRTQEPL